MFLFIFRVYKEKEEKREHEETRYSCCMLGKARLFLCPLGEVEFQASSSGEGWSFLTVLHYQVHSTFHWCAGGLLGSMLSTKLTFRDLCSPGVEPGMEEIEEERSGGCQCRDLKGHPHCVHNLRAEDGH